MRVWDTSTDPSGLTLTLDAAGDGCAAGLVRDGTILAHRHEPGIRGSAARLPLLVQAVLADASLPIEALAGIAVTVGPGSFTGVRAALAIAHGIALGAAIPLRGVTVGAALRADAGPRPRPVWVAIDNRRGRVVLDIDGHVAATALETVPAPDTPILLAGDAADAVAARLRTAGAQVDTLPLHAPSPAGIAAAPHVPPLPLYVEPPEARPGPPPRPAPA